MKESPAPWEAKEKSTVLACHGPPNTTPSSVLAYEKNFHFLSAHEEREGDSCACQIGG